MKKNSLYSSVISHDIPEELDLRYYRENNIDLNNFSDDEPINYFVEYGMKKGRIGSPYSQRENFISLIDLKSNMLEVGPFYSPLLVGANIKYFDVLDRNALIQRAKDNHIIDQAFLNRIPEIDDISPTGDMSIINEKFKTVISSHNIECHLDLVNHLNQISCILVDNGC